MGTGKMTSRKAMGNKNGKMGLFTKASTSREKNKEKGFLFGEMTALMKASFGRITSMGRASISGRMAGFM